MVISIAPSIWSSSPVFVYNFNQSVVHVNFGCLPVFVLLPCSYMYVPCSCLSIWLSYMLCNYFASTYSGQMYLLVVVVEFHVVEATYSCNMISSTSVTSFVAQDFWVHDCIRVVALWFQLPCMSSAASAAALAVELSQYLYEMWDHWLWFSEKFPSDILVFDSAQLVCLTAYSVELQCFDR